MSSLPFLLPSTTSSPNKQIRKTKQQKQNTLWLHFQHPTLVSLPWALLTNVSIEFRFQGRAAAAELPQRSCVLRFCASSPYSFLLAQEWDPAELGTKPQRWAHRKRHLAGTLLGGARMGAGGRGAGAGQRRRQPIPAQKRRGYT